MDMRAEGRNAALKELLLTLVAAKKVATDDVAPLFKALVKREELGSTALGNAVAVPHARVKDLDGTLVAFGYSSRGIAFNAIDGRPVHHVFLVIASESDSENYLAVLQKISRLLQSGDFRRFLRGVKDSQELLELIQEMDN